MDTQQKITPVRESEPISNGVKIKKFLLSGSIVALLLPGLALAVAYNDVSLQSGASLSVNSITINVTGATLSQLQADSTTFNVTLGPGSTVTLTAPNRNQMALGAGGSDFLSTSVCDGSNSNMTLTAPANAATTTVTITPSSTLCATSAGGGSGGGGGGGGGSGVVGTLRPSPLATSATSATSKTSLTAEQKSALISTLTAQLNALLAQIAVLKGEAAPSATAVASASANASFKRDLQVGSTGEDAKALQVYLNSRGFTVASSGAGSPGNETSRFGGLTRAALAKFQKSVGITPASGYFGPKTRAYIAAHP